MQWIITCDDELVRMSPNQSIIIREDTVMDAFTVVAMPQDIIIASNLTQREAATIIENLAENLPDVIDMNLL